MTSDIKKTEKTESEKMSFMDIVRWFFISAALVASIAANSYFEQQVSGAIRASIGIVIVAILLFSVYTTALGHKAWGFLKLSRNEMRKVVWPTKQETTQTTVMVVVIVLIASILLWAVDYFFQWYE